VSLLGVNASGEERDNALITVGRTLPWLQDRPGEDAWANWGVTWRDVVILDSTNVIVDVLNLTDHNLADPANRETLKQKLRDAGTR